MTKFVLFCSLAFTLSFPAICQEADSWKEAERRIIRLPGTAFPQLPSGIVSYLRKHGYTIPQSYINQAPHNVLVGEFRRRGQKDWAVLASRRGVSRILVFWGGKTTNVSQIGRAHDGDYLQVVESDRIGYSRYLAVVGEEYIVERHRRYGGPPPPITHDAIEDRFAEKASRVWYYDGRRWLQLTGAD